MCASSCVSIFIFNHILEIIESLKVNGPIPIINLLRNHNCVLSHFTNLYSTSYINSYGDNRWNPIIKTHIDGYATNLLRCHHYKRH